MENLQCTRRLVRRTASAKWLWLSTQSHYEGLAGLAYVPWLLANSRFCQWIS